MAPICVGIVGLAAKADSYMTGRGAWGVAAHLTSVVSSPKYELVAVCNSSIESAKRVIEGHSLPGSVVPYGNIEDMANDPNVELIVVSVNVAKHFAVTKPAMLKKKDVFVEWPLTATLQESQELTALAQQQGVRAIVGAQMRADPLYVRARELVKSGRIGKVTSSVATVCTSSIQSDTMPDTAAYFLDWNSGGNEFSIYFGHFLHGFTSVVGGFETVKAIMKTLGTTVAIVDSNTGDVIDKARQKTSPDFTFVQGVLKSGAVASLTIRKVKKPVDEVGFRWLITGTEGEIEIKSPEGHAPVPPLGRTLRLRLEETGVTETLDFEDAAEPDHVKIPEPGTNTARLYEAFATGKTESFTTFEDALGTQKLLDKIAQDAGFP